MFNQQKGFIKIIIITVIAFIIATAGYFILTQKNIEAPATIKESNTTDETAQLTNDKSATKDWKTYRNEEYGFEVKYPLNISAKNWAEETPNMSLLVNFGNNLNISDNVVSISIEKGTSITDIGTETGREDLFNDLRIEPQSIKDEKIGKDNYPAKKIDYKNGSSSLDFVKYLIDHSGLLYQVIYHRKAKSVITESNFDLMLSTFKFIENKTSKSSQSYEGDLPLTSKTPIIITSPTGGEQWEEGSSYLIKWNVPEEFKNEQAQLLFTDPECYDVGQVKEGERGCGAYKIGSVLVKQGYYNWNIPRRIKEKVYGVSIGEVLNAWRGILIMDFSGKRIISKQFTIVDNWKTYRNDQYGFEFKYPRNWTYSENIKKYPLGITEYKIQFYNESNKKMIFVRNPIFEGGWEPYELIEEKLISISNSDQNLKWQVWTINSMSNEPNFEEPSFIYVKWGNGKGSISTNFKDITEEKVVILRKILSTFKFTK